MFIKLAGKYFSLEDISFMEIDHVSPSYDVPVVRIQYRNRQDKVENVAGKAVHVKHGVYELPPNLSEELRWFLRIFGANLNVIDVQERYKDRERIEAMMEAAKAQAAANSAAGVQQQARGKVLSMPPFPPSQNDDPQNGPYPWKS